MSSPFSFFSSAKIVSPLILSLNLFQNEKRPEYEIWRYVSHISNALKYLHSYKIIHRDLKPANILIQKYDKKRCLAKIANFGVARNAERDILTLTFTNVQMLQR